MELRAFTTRLKILRAIDFPQLVDAGVLDSAECWRLFRENPTAWLVRTDDCRARALWALVEQRAAEDEPAGARELLGQALELLEDLLVPGVPDPDLETLVAKIKAAVGDPAAPSGFVRAGTALASADARFRR